MTTELFQWWRRWQEAEGVTVFHVDLSPDADREAHAHALLDDQERMRCRRFVVTGARRRFVLCRAALRVILAGQLDCQNRQLAFGHGKHGKPYALVNGNRVEMAFNVSHSGRHGLIATALHGWLGVDVEERAPGRDMTGIGSMVYGPRERQLLELAEGAQALHLFYRIWSLKEALIKAAGSGIFLDPSGFEVPESMLNGARSCVFQFHRGPASSWSLIDLGEARFAAALAYRLPSSQQIPASRNPDRSPISSV